MVFASETRTLHPAGTLVIPQLIQPLRCIRRYLPTLVVSEDTHQKQRFM